MSVLGTITEAQLQDAVEELAGWLGWRVWHDHDSRRNRAGLPDVVAVHAQQRRVLFAELKSARGRLRPDQEAWRADLLAAGAESYVWRPSDWLTGTIEAVLRQRPTTPAQLAQDRTNGSVSTVAPADPQNATQGATR